VWFALFAALLAHVDLSAVARSAKVDVTDRQTRVIALPDGRPLVIEITIGTVRIEGWDRQEAEITVERRAPTTSSFSRLPASIEEVPPGVVVRALQTDNATDPAFRSDVTVRLPRNATIERINVVEGRIVIEDFTGTINASLRRGPIDGRAIAGTIRLETQIGDVTLTNTRLSAGGLLRLRTFNGDVKLSLVERPADARVMALALNGQIKSEIPLKMRDTWGPRWGEATIGKGEPVISLDVVTGLIEIKSP
jgi:hypothetical protein